MSFDLEQTDQLLSTTRAVRRRLDLDRNVPDDLLLRCIELAEQAPTGGDISSRRWLVVRDPEIKKKLADLYREAGGNRIVERAERHNVPNDTGGPGIPSRVSWIPPLIWRKTWSGCPSWYWRRSGAFMTAAGGPDSSTR